MSFVHNESVHTVGLQCILIERVSILLVSVSPTVNHILALMYHEYLIRDPLRRGICNSPKTGFGNLNVSVYAFFKTLGFGCTGNSHTTWVYIVNKSFQVGRDRIVVTLLENLCYQPTRQPTPGHGSPKEQVSYNCHGG